MNSNAKALPPPLRDLLGQVAWTRRLARSLIGSDADDVVQDTWLAAMRRPPDTSQPVRPWLATVVRNQASNRLRESARRRDRETRVETRQSPQTSEDLLARMEVHKILVESVGALAEPYRQTVLLAYFEGLSSSEIGDRQNVPPSTVRGRLSTALELLREALDGRLGERAAWLASVADLARGTSPGPSALESTSSATTAVARPGSVGALATVLGVVAVLATGASVTVWQVARRPRAATQTTSEVAGVQASRAQGDLVDKQASRAQRDLSPPSRASSDRGAGALSNVDLVSAQRLNALFVAYRNRSSSTVGLSSGSGGGGACTIATKGESAVARACAKGGRAEAKKLMKEMVKSAKTMGQKLACENCHIDLETFDLRENARDDYAKLEDVSKGGETVRR
jgi:RNA polymerase sigma factor (sigma-70 family)